MKDKNGKEMTTGMMVVISGGFFKADNGLFRIAHSPGDENWLGNDYCLRKMNKDGTESKGTYTTAFWPLSISVSSYDLRSKAKAHNKENATIEVIDFVPVKAPKPQEGIKFYYNGIKVNGTLYKVFYSIGNCRNEPEGTITIYARDVRLPRIDGLNIKNETDSQTDYFENDRARVRPTSKYYNEAKAAAELAQAKFQARIAKKSGTAA